MKLPHRSLRLGVALAASLLAAPALAVVGMPATPGSVAGVARRTTRRTVAATAAATPAPAPTVVTVLPSGCRTVVTGGVTYHQCGAVYYRPYYQGGALVYQVVPAP